MQENESLESLLMLAREDEEADAQFVRELFQSEIYFLGEVLEDEEGSEESEEAQISVVDWETSTGHHFIPAFTSLRMLEQSVSEDQAYIKVKAADFFKSIEGNMVSINPGTGLERVISSDEVEILLSIFRTQT